MIQASLSNHKLPVGLPKLIFIYSISMNNQQWILSKSTELVGQDL